MKISFLILFAFGIVPLSSQNAHPENVVHQLFEAMASVDTALLNSLVDDNAVLSSTSIDVQGMAKVGNITKEQFIASVSRAVKGDLDERISNLHTFVDDGLANVWMDYTFYYKGQMSHCGVNNFTLAKSQESWKIISLADTRRKENCTFDQEQRAINNLLDNWHLAASNADSTRYFDMMTSTSIFIGTDKTEVWNKGEFLAFASPYFSKGKAWDFKKINRNVYSQDFENIAWFDELLETWMGPCRGSGVVVRENGDWKIQHYVLSVTVPNDDIKEFLKIYEK